MSVRFQSCARTCTYQSPVSVCTFSELCADVYSSWLCVSELCADVYRRQSAESQSMADEMISLMIGGVGCSVAARTHTLEITSTLAGVTLKVHGQRDCSLSHGAPACCRTACGD